MKDYIYDKARVSRKGRLHWDAIAYFRWEITMIKTKGGI